MKSFNRDYIKSRRLFLRITHKEMSVKLGFKNASNYLKYENGTYSFKAEILPVLAKILKCQIQDFFK